MRAPAARAALIVPLLLCCTAVAAGVVSQLAHPDDFYERDPAGFDYLLERGSRNTLPVGKASRDAGVAADTVEPTLILLMANANYTKVLLNFVWILETRLEVYNYGIACMDHELYEYLSERRIQCYRMALGDDPGASEVNGSEQQTVRMELILNLLRAGVNVIQNDVDAVWRSDVRLDLQQADITGQRDQSPPDLREKWGSTFCTGTLFLRSCEQTVSFMEAVLNNTALHTFLDQRKFNHGLEGKTNGGVTWLSPPESRAYRDKDATGDVSRGVCKGWRNMTVALLPQRPYRRECSRNKYNMRDAKIIHCNRDKKGIRKEEMLRAFEAWELPDHFEICLRTDGMGFAFSGSCAERMQRPYKDIRVDWCRELAEALDLRPLVRGPFYEGPLFEPGADGDAAGSPWGAAAGSATARELYATTGLGTARGCEVVIGRMGK